MQVTQYNQPPRQPFFISDKAFDSRPIPFHGVDNYGIPAEEDKRLKMPNPAKVPEENLHYPFKLQYRPGFTENRKPVYEYPEVTGVFMRPPALRKTNHQIAQVSGRTYEIEGEQVKARLAGAPALELNRTWDSSYQRYIY